MSLRQSSSRRVSNVENETTGNSRAGTVKRISETSKSRSVLNDLSNGDSSVTATKSSSLLNRSLTALPSSTRQLPTRAALQPLKVANSQSLLPPTRLCAPFKALHPLSQSTNYFHSHSNLQALTQPQTRSQLQPKTQSSTYQSLVSVKSATQSFACPNSQRDNLIATFDQLDISDPKFVSEYVGEIFGRLMESPSARTPLGNYLSQGHQINEAMRSVLVDWLVEVHWKFKLYPESLFLTVSLLDRFLAKMPTVSKTQFQLVGTTCLLIAAKYEDIFAPEIKDLVMICEKTYKREEILAMECKILNTVEFDLTIPSALLFLLRLGKIQGCDERHFYLAQYCLELALPVYGLWTSKASLTIAAAALYLSNKLLRKPKAWGEVLGEVTGLNESELKPVAKELCNVLQIASEDGVGTSGSRVMMKAVKNKFSQSKYHGVAKMVL